eukprot:8329871-Pyramimonas_sp.AAC.1
MIDNIARLSIEVIVIATLIVMRMAHHHASCLSVLAVTVEAFGQSGLKEARIQASKGAGSVEAIDSKAYVYN